MGSKTRIEDFQERVNRTHPFSKIEILEYESVKSPLMYKCLDCGKVYELKRAEGIFSRLNPCSCKKNFYSRKEKIKFFE